MPEAAAVEAVRAIQAANATQSVGTGGIDPAAVAAFNGAMGAESAQAATPIPFVEQISATWKSTQVRMQEHLRRMEKLSELSQRGVLTVGQLTAMQYELQTANFQLEVSTIVAKKSSEMVQTLVKNG